MCSRVDNSSLTLFTPESAKRLRTSATDNPVPGPLTTALALYTVDIFDRMSRFADLPTLAVLRVVCKAFTEGDNQLNLQKALLINFGVRGNPRDFTPVISKVTMWLRIRFGALTQRGAFADDTFERSLVTIDAMSRLRSPGILTAPDLVFLKKAQGVMHLHPRAVTFKPSESFLMMSLCSEQLPDSVKKEAIDHFVVTPALIEFVLLSCSRDLQNYVCRFESLITESLVLKLCTPRADVELMDKIFTIFKTKNKLIKLPDSILTSLIEKSPERGWHGYYPDPAIRANSTPEIKANFEKLVELLFKHGAQLEANAVLACFSRNLFTYHEEDFSETNGFCEFCILCKGRSTPIAIQNCLFERIQNRSLNSKILQNLLPTGSSLTLVDIASELDLSSKVRNGLTLLNFIVSNSLVWNFDDLVFFKKLLIAKGERAILNLDNLFECLKSCILDDHFNADIDHFIILLLDFYLSPSHDGIPELNHFDLDQCPDTLNPPNEDVMLALYCLILSNEAHFSEELERRFSKSSIIAWLTSKGFSADIGSSVAIADIFRRFTKKMDVVEKLKFFPDFLGWSFVSNEDKLQIIHELPGASDNPDIKEWMEKQNLVMGAKASPAPVMLTALRSPAAPSS